MQYLNKVPILLTSRKNNEKQECQRTNKVFQLVMNPNNVELDAYWQETSALKIARTGHTILTVPKNYAPKCGRK